MLILKQIAFLHKHILPYTLILFFTASSSSLAQQVKFHRISPPEGSYFGMVNGVTQDSQGYVWFSSFGFGLYRYDGYHVTRFRTNPKDPGSLASNDVACVLADHNGFIWIGTANSGLDRFDPATGIFTHFRHKKEEAASLSDDGVIHSLKIIMVSSGLVRRMA